MKLRVVGMMSGTSFDAIEIAVAEFDLVDRQLAMTPIGATSADLPADLRRRINDILPPTPIGIEQVARLDADLGRAFADAAQDAIREIADGRADLVGSHGQTVFHWIENGSARGTLQLGNPAWIAQRTGLPVVSDIRNRDIAAGGQGAPLASLMDALMILNSDQRRGALNLGGIANITVGDGESVIAYDIGPANALLDATVRALTHGAQSYDAEGERAVRGTVRADLLERLLAEPYYARPAPKTTGKELFHSSYVSERLVGLPPVDGDDLLATLTELTAQIVAGACASRALDDLVVSGGGTENPVLMQRISELAAPCGVRRIEEFGIASSAKEAYLVALIAYLTVHGLPGTLPGATGAPTGSILGSVTPATSGWALPAPGARSPTQLVLHAA